MMSRCGYIIMAYNKVSMLYCSGGASQFAMVAIAGYFRSSQERSFRQIAYEM